MAITGLLLVLSCLHPAQAAGAGVAGFMAGQVPGTGDVSLAWAYRGGENEETAFEVKRDGALLVRTTAMVYTDAAVPAGRHTYTVRAAQGGAPARSALVQVLPPCAAAPQVSLEAALAPGPLADGELLSLVLSGEVLQPEGCSLRAAYFHITGDRGLRHDGILGVESGRVRTRVSVEAQAVPEQRDARLRVEASVENEAGAGTAQTEVLVPKKKR